MPEVSLDFHCKEVSVMAEGGKQLNPSIHWYTDETCLARGYDLVMISGSLQYIEDWRGELLRIIKSVDRYFFLARLPVIENKPSFVAIQRVYGTQMFHQQFNQKDVLQIVESAGLRCIREFVVGDLPYIKNAPEQCELRSWLFKRDFI